MVPRLLFFALLISFSTHLFAQDDDTIRFVQGLPMTGEDTSSNEYQASPDMENFVRISQEQIPPGLLKTLRKDKLFVDWENQPVFFDKKTELYWIRFSNGKVVRSYGFSESGAPVTIREENVPELRD